MAAPDSIEQSLGFLSPMERASNDYKRILDTLQLQQGQQQNNVRAADLGMNMPVYMGMQAASGYPGQGKPMLPDLNNAALPDSTLDSAANMSIPGLQGGSQPYNPGAIGSVPPQTQTPSLYKSDLPGFPDAPPPPAPPDYSKAQQYYQVAQAIKQSGGSSSQFLQALTAAKKAKDDADNMFRKASAEHTKELTEWQKEHSAALNEARAAYPNGGKPYETSANPLDVTRDKALGANALGIKAGDKLRWEYPLDSRGIPTGPARVTGGGPTKSQVDTTTQTVEPAAASSEVEEARQHALAGEKVMDIATALHARLDGAQGTQYVGKPGQLLLSVDNIIRPIKQSVDNLVSSNKLSPDAGNYFKSEEFKKDIGWDAKTMGAALTQSDAADIIATLAAATTKNHTLGKEDAKLIAHQYGTGLSDPQKFMAVTDARISQFPRDLHSMATYASPDGPKAASKSRIIEMAGNMDLRYARYRGETAPQTSGDGWVKHQDAQGRWAYVSPDGKSFKVIK